MNNINRDWFRGSGWTTQDQQLFYQKLNKQRSDLAKAQSLRVKALYLVEAKRNDLTREAILLLKHAARISDTENEPVYLQMAECYEFLGDKTKAAHYYQESLSAHENHPNLFTQAPNEYAEFIVLNKLEDLYNEAGEVITNKALLITMDQNFAFHIIRAFLFDALHNPSLVPDEILRAHYFAEVKQSGIRGAPKIGIMNKNRRKSLFRILRDLENKYRKLIETAQQNRQNIINPWKSNDITSKRIKDGEIKYSMNDFALDFRPVLEADLQNNKFASKLDLPTLRLFKRDIFELMTNAPVIMTDIKAASEHYQISQDSISVYLRRYSYENDIMLSIMDLEYEKLHRRFGKDNVDQVHDKISKMIGEAIIIMCDRIC